MNKNQICPRGAFLFIILLVFVGIVSADTNTVQVYVHPGSGTVCLDNFCQVNRGTLNGYSSTQFPGVASGQQHTIKVYDTEGYQDYSDQVYMDQSGHSMTFSIYLEPVPVQTPDPGTGTIQVTVSPGMGQVCLDNRECETSTGEPASFWNVQFSDVPADIPHTITVTADGYQQYTQTVTIQPDMRNDVDIALQPLRVESVSAPPSTAPVVSTTKAPGALITILSALGIFGIIRISRVKK